MIGLLTISIFLIAIIFGVGAFKLGKGFGYMVRPAFSVMTFLAVWSLMVTIFWLLGVDLKVGTVQDGKMEDNWWLPVATIAFAALTYFVGCQNRKSKEHGAS